MIKMYNVHGTVRSLYQGPRKRVLGSGTERMFTTVIFIRKGNEKPSMSSINGSINMWRIKNGAIKMIISTNIQRKCRMLSIYKMKNGCTELNV